jgi:hypothetical protein
MSEEKLEFVRRGLMAYNEAGMLSALEAFWHADVTWHTDPNVPEPGVYSGRKPSGRTSQASFERSGARLIPKSRS